MKNGQKYYHKKFYSQPERVRVLSVNPINLSIDIINILGIIIISLLGILILRG